MTRRCCGGEVADGRVCSCGTGGEVRGAVPSDADIFTMDAVVRGLNGATSPVSLSDSVALPATVNDRIREAADRIGEVTDPETRRALYSLLGLVVSR